MNYKPINTTTDSSNKTGSTSTSSTKTGADSLTKNPGSSYFSDFQKSETGQHSPGETGTASSYFSGFNKNSATDIPVSGTKEISISSSKTGTASSYFSSQNTTNKSSLSLYGDRIMKSSSELANMYTIITPDVTPVTARKTDLQKTPTPTSGKSKKPEILDKYEFNTNFFSTIINSFSPKAKEDTPTPEAIIKHRTEKNQEKAAHQTYVTTQTTIKKAKNKILYQLISYLIHKKIQKRMFEDLIQCLKPHSNKKLESQSNAEISQLKLTITALLSPLIQAYLKLEPIEDDKNYTEDQKIACILLTMLETTKKCKYYTEIWEIWYMLSGETPIEETWIAISESCDYRPQYQQVTNKNLILPVVVTFDEDASITNSEYLTRPLLMEIVWIIVKNLTQYNQELFDIFIKYLKAERIQFRELVLDLSDLSNEDDVYNNKISELMEILKATSSTLLEELTSIQVIYSTNSPKEQFEQFKGKLISIFETSKVKITFAPKSDY